VPHRVPLRLAELVQPEQLGLGDSAQHRGVDRFVQAGRLGRGQFGEQRAQFTGAPLGVRRRRVAEPTVPLVVAEIRGLDRVVVQRRG
jgi:hypothetical protein